MRAGAVQLAPTFPSVRLAGQSQPLSLGSIVSFTRVRVVLLRANGDTVADRVVEFPADSASISLAFTVTLDQSAPATGEVLSASLRLIAANGDTVFRGGPVQVVAAPTTATPPTAAEIPLSYSGPGASAASIVVSPKTRAARTADVIPFTATVRDAQGATLANTPVAYTSLDTTKVRVGLATGSALVAGFRGSAVVVAQTLTGQADSAVVTIVPTPTVIAVVAGNNQSVEQQRVFPTPVRVVVSAGDGLPVAGEVVVEHQEGRDLGHRGISGRVGRRRRWAAARRTDRARRCPLTVASPVAPRSGTWPPAPRSRRPCLSRAGSTADG